MFKLFSLFKRVGKRHNPIMSFTKVVLILGCISFGVFLLIDSDYIYYNWFMQTKQQESKASSNMLLNANGELVNADDFDGLGSESSEYYGINMMIINKMAEGYCKDYLVIAQQHSNGESMQYTPVVPDVDGNPLQISLSHIITMSSAESNNWQGIPKSLINLESYGKSSGSLTAKEMTFYSLNHNSYKKANSKDLYSGYWKLAAAHPTLTTFQLGNYRMSYPKEYMTKKDGVDGGKPSKMNGYGYSQGTLRTIDQTDAAYLPDLFAYVIQSTLNTAAAYPDKVFTNDGLALLSSIIHNSGPSAPDNKVVYGQSSAPKVRLKLEEQQKLIARYLNDAAECIKKGEERDGSLVSKINLFEGSHWRSYIAGVLISEGGYRIGDYCETTGYKYLTGNAARRDALYLGLTGKYVKNVSDAVVKQEWNKYKPFVLDGKYAKGKIDSYGNSGYLYKTHPDAKITGMNGQQVDACTQINLITLAHMSSVIAGKYYIWRMAQYSGVDCSPDEIFVVNKVNNSGGGTNNPNTAPGTGSSAVRAWFIKAAKDVDKGAIKDPDTYYGGVYDKMSSFAKLMLNDWYWYVDTATGSLHGKNYLWGGRCYYVPDNLSVDKITYSTPAGDNGNSLKYFKESCKGHGKRYGFDCAGLVRTIASDVLPNGLVTSGNSTQTTFCTYAGLSKAYGGYYNGNNPLGIGPLYKKAYTFQASSNFSKMPVTLQPFDILGHNGHILYFICWIDQSAGRMLTLEATTSNQHTGLHSTSISGSLKGTVGLIQFDHANAYKYIMSNKRCTKANSNATTDSDHTTWNSAKNWLASRSDKLGHTGGGEFLNSNYLGKNKEKMQALSKF